MEHVANHVSLSRLTLPIVCDNRFVEMFSNIAFLVLMSDLVAKVCADPFIVEHGS